MNGITSNQPPRSFPARFADIKREIAEGKEETIVKAWKEVTEALAARTKVAAETGPDIIPQVEFSDLRTLSNEEIERIRQVGAVVIRNVVDDDEALGYKEALKEYVKANPHVHGFPEGNKQFFEMYWSSSQLRSRSHPNVQAAGVWLNNLWRAGPQDVVDLNKNICYADRFRIRQPSKQNWGAHTPHIDGASTERWEDPSLRSTYDDIFKGDWNNYDPFAISGRLTANTRKYGRPNQSSVFRTFQGWMAMSDTGPGEGTIRFFPDLVLANTYIMLRPFFKPAPGVTGDALLDASNWVFDVSDPNIPGIEVTEEGQFTGVRPSEATHPHLKLDTAIVSAPRVKPGDMVFWHCDLIHSVEGYHNGPNDSSVVYIPAVPLTPQNVRYLARHRDNFQKRIPPPDFPQGIGEVGFVNQGQESDIAAGAGRLAMGLEPFQADDNATEGAKEAIKIANEVLGF